MKTGYLNVAITPELKKALQQLKVNTGKSIKRLVGEILAKELKKVGLIK